MGSLQDALLKAGLAESKPRKTDRKAHPSAGGGQGKAKANADAQRAVAKAGKPAKPASRKRRPAPESDLERAYKARARAEAAEKEQVKKDRLAAQEARRQRNLKLDAIVREKTLNRKDAEFPRYFEHLGRIRRVLCSSEQRDQLNSGELGVVALRGSYLLVSLETMAAFAEVAPDLVPDLSPKEPEDDGSDYPPVPDDLIW